MNLQQASINIIGYYFLSTWREFHDTLLLSMSNVILPACHLPATYKRKNIVIFAGKSNIYCLSYHQHLLLSSCICTSTETITKGKFIYIYIFSCFQLYYLFTAITAYICFRCKCRIIYCHYHIALAVSVRQWPGRPGFSPRSSHTKMVLDASLLNTQRYKVWIKGKVDQYRERSSALRYTLV